VVLCAISHATAQRIVGASGNSMESRQSSQPMTNHKEVVVVQENGCGALWNLSHNNPENQRRIGELGGIEAIITAMTIHKEFRWHPRNGCGAIMNLLSMTEMHVSIHVSCDPRSRSDGVNKFPSLKWRHIAWNSITPQRHPAAIKVMKQNCCTLIHVPRCSSKRCGADDGYWCEDCWHSTEDVPVQNVQWRW